MHLLARNLIENGSDKFFAFDRVQRLKSARRMVEFHDRYPNLRERGVDTFRAFIADQGAAIDAERTRLWGERARPITGRTSISIDQTTWDRTFSGS